MKHTKRTPPEKVPAAVVLVLPLLAAGAALTAEPPAHPNVLFIAIDDLNHWVGHLGRNRQVLTPNLDRLARRGVTFTRAYCAAPLCNPSRAALMSGRRPASTGIYENGTDWRPLIAADLTLPAHFRKHGYHVAGAGKIYHGGLDRPSEWDDYYRGASGRGGGEGRAARRGGTGSLRWVEVDGDETAMGDHHVVTWACGELEKKREQPFFLACGIFRPHLPWIVPRKYFDLYPLERIELPPFREDDLADLPAAGVRMANPRGDHAAVVSAGIWKEAVRAYLAAVSFADFEIGRLLEALDRSPHKDSTVIVLWGDHGWHLGEKHHWRKFTLWEEAARVPFIWVVPGVTKPGSACHRPVDLMSVYPTLAEACGLPVPAHVEGASVLKLLRDPGAEWTGAALTTHGAGNHAVRTEVWRYIRYADGGEELYDEVKDPYEWENLAGKPEHAVVKADLARRLPKEDRPAPEPRRKKARKKDQDKDQSGDGS